MGEVAMIQWRISSFVFRSGFLLAILILLLSGAAQANAQASAQCTNQGVGNSATGNVTWTPQFCQEFNGAALSAIDTTVWSFDLGDGCPNVCKWGNNEVEIYCGPPGYAGNPTICPNSLTTSNNAYIDGSGHLVIQAINNGGTWLSTRMKTQGIENFTYGRIEANIQLPDTTNQGLWPAFWSLGTNITTVNWPTCGEDDFMEVWSPTLGGAGTGGNISTIHTKNTDGAGVQTNKHTFAFLSGMANNTALHKYGVIWSANMVQHYVDDPTHPFYIATISDLGGGDLWPFSASSFILLNLAVGGNLGGSTSGLASPTQPYLVDYVRQYKTSAPVPAPVLPAPSITVKAGDSSGVANTSKFTPGLTSGTGFVFFNCTTNAPKSSCSVGTSDPVSPFVVNSSPSGAAETVTVTVTTTANAILPPFFFNPRVRFWAPVVVAELMVLVMAFFLALRTQNRVWRHVCGMATVLILAAVAIAGCGGGSSMAPPPPNNGTPPGSYTVTVYAFTESNTSDGNNANADAHVDISLTVN
jgi:beta-glucanase (GH16 family)